MVTIMSENFAPMRTGTYPRKATMTRILIVEDEESDREPLVYQLTREGYDVSAAATGEEGLELFTKGGIDLVLLDLMLPGIDGTALCRRIREQSRVPIIMLTAKSAEIDKVVGLEIGADDYVTKPYSFRELLARIRAVMRRNQATAQASGHCGMTIFRWCVAISPCRLASIRSPYAAKPCSSRSRNSNCSNTSCRTRAV